jgi:BMFP domain-containing protein YqiC
MAKLLNEQELRKQAVEALAEKLGPVEALRFLALVSREEFDYQQWRKKYFSRYNVDELSKEIRHLQRDKGS